MSNTKWASCDKINYEVKKMNGTERREKIVAYIRDSKEPVSGQKLAEIFDVSRQVIVQDMALIRANGVEILSTHRGYVIDNKKSVNRVFYVNHTDEQLEDELCMIVDMGGKIVNVMVEHKVYGKLEAELQITSRHKVYEFVESMKSGSSSPLKNLTSNLHAHLVEAEDEKTLDMIEDKLREMGILV